MFEKKRKNIGKKKKKKRRIKVGRKRLSAFKSFMSVRNTTFKYEKYEIEVEGTYNDVMVAMNKNEEIKIVKCQVCV